MKNARVSCFLPKNSADNLGFKLTIFFWLVPLAGSQHLTFTELLRTALLHTAGPVHFPSRIYAMETHQGATCHHPLPNC